MELGYLDLAVPKGLVGFVSKISVVTSAAAELESISPWGSGMGVLGHRMLSFLTGAS